MDGGRRDRANEETSLNSEIPTNGEDYSTGSCAAAVSRAVQELRLPSPGFVNPTTGIDLLLL